MDTLTTPHTNSTVDWSGFDENRAHFLRVQVQFWLMAVIIPCGLLLNSAAFGVFLSSPALRQYTRTLFLMALCMADSLYLIGEYMQQFLELFRETIILVDSTACNGIRLQ